MRASTRAAPTWAYSRCLWVDHPNYILPSAFDIDVPSHAAGLRHADMAMTLCSVAHTRACVERHGWWDEGLLRAGDTDLIPYSFGTATGW